MSLLNIQYAFQPGNISFTHPCAMRKTFELRKCFDNTFANKKLNKINRVKLFVNNSEVKIATELNRF